MTEWWLSPPGSAEAGRADQPRLFPRICYRVGDALAGAGRRDAMRRYERALRSVDRLPEVERRALIVGALGDQPVRLALGLVRVAAGRPDPLDRGPDVVDAVGQLHLGLRALRRPDAQRRPGLVGTPRAGVTGGERHP